MNNEQEERLEALRQALRDSERLDMVAAAKLRAARARAVDAARRPARPWLWAVPAAATAVLVAALWLPGAPPVTGPQPQAAGTAVASEALDVLTDEQSPDFYQDLELYEWLDREAGRA
ncbi:hypothetical protein C3942_05670 [Solimonas fluminis]|uniref:DUF3619 domain-containing protein n=1 Tax=Solimonas fluminis TaxID=2086571 RepID=A0A2S5TJL1_9GAMM|nr:hypothetical protein [Solimonas fluminis]PPE75163.1 hypothetical protein C3942_05670 [Solimonas fluminis]